MSFTKGGEKVIRALMTPFFGDLCQRGREHEPKSKRTATPPNFKTNDFQLISFKLVSYYVQKGEKVVFSKLISQNPLEH
jgi:hypothetical protein